MKSARTVLEGRKKGAVSLYIVLFATLLITVIALGFTRIMLNERRQVSDSDLSQTAYDSAMTGIEDAKLAVLRYNECLSTDAQYPSGSTTRTCADITSVMRTGQPTAGSINACDGIAYILGRPTNNETPIQEGGADSATFEQTDQAYTCVRVSDDTIDFLSTFDAQTRARLIPLRTGGVEFNQIVISWSRARNNISTASLPTNSTSSNPPIQLPEVWAESAPPVLSATLIQTAKSFTLSQFETASGSTTNRAGLLLVPVRGGGANTIAASAAANFTNVGGVLQTNDQKINNPFPISCTNPVGGDYSCSVTINLPSPVGGSRHDGTSFLMLESVYPSGTHDFQVRAQNNGTVVPLVGVQVAVDSTGRNADSLRRIEGRIEVVDTAYPYPEWAVQLNGESGASFCKNFIVTTNNWITGQNVYDYSSC
ncbi:MAG: hypothetical protein LBM12_00775 [Candidatus Nomurabacteria bacterium]|jgi:Tfp pilus assembly protein PilX|nr:hypothetical protein [Candidatus Nomurabacteria bacterium]